MPGPTLPNESEANSESAAANAALVAAANDEFIANATVLINDAINNGFFEIEPVIITHMDVPTVTTYFEGFGYTVVFPLIPSFPFNPPFIAGFPEVLPPGYIPPFSNPSIAPPPPRMKISWGP